MHRCGPGPLGPVERATVDRFSAFLARAPRPGEFATLPAWRRYEVRFLAWRVGRRP